MIQVTSHTRILVAVEPVDFRNGIDGLAQDLQGSAQGRPFRGLALCLPEPAGDIDKSLMYDSQGFWLCQKRMSSREVSILAWKAIGRVEVPGSARTAGAAGRWRSRRGPRSAGMAPCESGG